MTEKRFEMIITGADGSFHYLDKNTGEKITSTLELENKLNEVHEENQELKKELQTYHKVAGCFNCDYHHYDWFDDGDEFEVCRKGNDVTERICKEWREL